MEKTGIIWQTQTLPFDPSKGEISQPNQQLQEIARGLTVTELLLTRLNNMRNPEWPLVASISEAPSWDGVAAIAAKVLGEENVVRGSDTNRLQNQFDIMKDRDMNYAVRITGDNPWIDSIAMDEMLNIAQESDFDFMDNYRPNDGFSEPQGLGWPDGFGMDVISFEGLGKTLRHKNLLVPNWDELHVVVFGREMANEEHAKKFGVKPFKVGYYNLPKELADTSPLPQLFCASPEHLEIHRKIYLALIRENLNPRNPTQVGFEEVSGIAKSLCSELPAGYGMTVPQGSRGLTTKKLIERNLETRLKIAGLTSEGLTN